MQTFPDFVCRLYVTEGCAFAGQLSSEARPFETFLNIDDEALVERSTERPPRPQPIGVPTKVSYLIAQTRLSAFISDFNRNQGTPTYDAVLIYDANLQHLLNDMPFFHPQATPQPSDPPWLPTARHVMALSIPQKRLLLHRHYFALSATDMSYVHSRQVSVDASLAILAERRVHDFPFDDKLDTLNHALPAAIVLLLDVLHPLPGTMYSPDKVRRRCLEVEELLSPLRGTATKHSTVALAKRVNMLDDLLQSTVEDLQKQTSPSQMFKEIEAPPLTNMDGFSAMLEELGFSEVVAFIQCGLRLTTVLCRLAACRRWQCLDLGPYAIFQRANASSTASAEWCTVDVRPMRLYRPASGSTLPYWRACFGQ